MNTCPVCAHSQRAAIDAALASGMQARTVGEVYGLTLRTLTTHQRHCTPDGPGRTKGAKAVFSYQNEAQGQPEPAQPHGAAHG